MPGRSHCLSAWCGKGPLGAQVPVRNPSRRAKPFPGGDRCTFNSEVGGKLGVCPGGDLGEFGDRLSRAILTHTRKSVAPWICQLSPLHKHPSCWPLLSRHEPADAGGTWPPPGGGGDQASAPSAGSRPPKPLGLHGMMNFRWLMRMQAVTSCHPPSLDRPRR